MFCHVTTRDMPMGRANVSMKSFRKLQKAVVPWIIAHSHAMNLGAEFKEVHAWSPACDRIRMESVN